MVTIGRRSEANSAIPVCDLIGRPPVSR